MAVSTESIKRYTLRTVHIFWAALRIVTMALAVCAGLCIFVMIGATCLDVVMRIFGGSIHGAYDIVRIAGALTIACALPYTTAVKGHVAIEYFFHKLNKTGRFIVDTLCRLLTIGLFAVLAYQSMLFGHSLRSSGSVSPTLQAPLYWIPYVIAFSCLITMLVTVHSLFHPGREMIKP